MKLNSCFNSDLESEVKEVKGDIVSSQINYCDVFNRNLEDKAKVARILQTKFGLKKEFIEEMKNLYPLSPGDTENLVVCSRLYYLQIF